MDTILQDILPVLPARLHAPLRRMEDRRPEDIRLRVGQPPSIYAAGWETPLDPAPVTWQELERILMAATDYSCYAAADQLAEGYVTLPGGHRIGVCGTLAVRGGSVQSVRNVSSLCIRLARDVPCRVPELTGSALLLGAPGSGKTTLLRDIVRILSDEGTAVGLCDERGEIAACVEGVPQLDVGARTHVLDGCAKASGLRWLLRAMCPGLLAMDELYGGDECLAVREAAACGVPVLTTLHAATAREVCLRTGIEGLLAEGIFEQVIFVRERRVTCVLPAAEVLKQGCCGQ